MADLEKVIKGLEMCIKDIECTGCPYEGECFYDDDRQFGESMMTDALALLKKQETVEHALDVLRKNGWKEEGTCEKCPLLTALSDGVHEMAQQFRMGGETNG